MKTTLNFLSDTIRPNQPSTTKAPVTKAPIIKTLTVASLSAFLIACGSSGEQKKPYTNPDEEAHEHEHEDGHDDKYHIETQGRLAIAHAADNRISFINLDDGKSLGSLTASKTPSALHASPDKRFALAFSRNEHRVDIFDGGLYQEDHGDHLHDYAKAPNLLSLSFDGKKPTHYEVHEHKGAIFFDGDDAAEPKINAKIAVFKDSDLLGLTPTFIDLDKPMHGTAEPRGDYLLTTKRNTNTTILPDAVVLYKANENAGKTSYALQKTFANACPMLHGSYSNEHYTVFGCDKHVLSIKQDGDTFSDAIIANTSGLKGRIGSFIGTDGQDSFIGFASGKPYIIDPVAGTMISLEWNVPADVTVKRAKFDAAGEHALILDSAGSLHVFEASDNFALKSNTKVLSSLPKLKGHAQPALDVGQGDAAGKAYLLDTSSEISSVIVFDIETAKMTKLPLDFAAQHKLVWLGIASNEAHEHAH